MSELVQVQSVRLKTGDISEADYMQSRVEELQLQNDLKEAEAAATAAQFAMCTFLGRESGQTTLMPKGALNAPSQEYPPDQLITMALSTRSNLVALRHARDSAQNAVRLAKSERFDDVELGVSYTHNPASNNLVGASPRYNELGIGLSMPLPLWNRNQHGIRKAQAFFNQSMRQLEAAELNTTVEIRIVLTQYHAALERVRQFQGELLSSAETVLAARRKSYEYGETSLLELLEAQRTANDIRKNYHYAIADAVKLHLEVQRVAALAENPIFNTETTRTKQ
jgi:cobalt-zinc-cadmium efflux system outer membrane protein